MPATTGFGAVGATVGLVCFDGAWLTRRSSLTAPEFQDRHLIVRGDLVLA